MNVNIDGYCPMGCGRTLFAASGHITCSYIECPDPTAVATILDDRETEHIVELTRDSWTVRHPLKERLGDALMSCELGAYLGSLGGPPRVPGRYRALLIEDVWTFRPVVL